MPALIDDNMHNFRVPARLRADSDGMLHPHQSKTSANLKMNPNNSTEFKNSSSETSAGNQLLLGQHTTMSGGAIVDSVSAKAVYGEAQIQNFFGQDAEEEKKTPRSQKEIR